MGTTASGIVAQTGMGAASTVGAVDKYTVRASCGFSVELSELGVVVSAGEGSRLDDAIEQALTVWLSCSSSSRTDDDDHALSLCSCSSLEPKAAMSWMPASEAQ